MLSKLLYRYRTFDCFEKLYCRRIDASFPHYGCARLWGDIPYLENGTLLELFLLFLTFLTMS
jgi:hypothetical protein